MAKDRARIPVFAYRLDYSLTPVTTAAYVQIVASLGSDVNELEVFDSSGEVMQLAIGPVGKEVLLNFFLIPGGQAGRFSCLLNAGMRLSIKAITANAIANQFIINGYK